MAEEIEYFRRDHDHCMVAWNRLLIWYSFGKVEPIEVDEMTGYFDVMAERFPDGFGFMLYASQDCQLPTQTGRRAASQMFAKQKGRLHGMVAVFEGHGFFMATARAIVSTMLALARQPFETHVSGNIEDSLAWLCARTPQLRDAPDAAQRAKDTFTEIARVHAQLLSSAA